MSSKKNLTASKQGLAFMDKCKYGENFSVFQYVVHLEGQHFNWYFKEQYHHDQQCMESDASCRLTQWLKIIPHMVRSYYRCCCINEPVIFSHCVHLKLGHWFLALLKVCSDRDDTGPFSDKCAAAWMVQVAFIPGFIIRYREIKWEIMLKIIAMMCDTILFYTKRLLGV